MRVLSLQFHLRVLFYLGSPAASHASFLESLLDRQVGHEDLVGKSVFRHTILHSSNRLRSHRHECGIVTAHHTSALRLRFRRKKHASGSFADCETAETGKVHETVTECDHKNGALAIIVHDHGIFSVSSNHIDKCQRVTATVGRDDKLDNNKFRACRTDDTTSGDTLRLDACTVLALRTQRSTPSKSDMSARLQNSARQSGDLCETCPSPTQICARGQNKRNVRGNLAQRPRPV